MTYLARVVLLCFLLTTVPAADAQRRIQYNLRPGDSFYVQLTTNRTGAFTVAGNVSKEVSEHVVLQKLEVLRVEPNENVRVLHTIVKTLEKKNGQDIKEPLSMAGANVQVTYNTAMVPQRIDGYEEFIQTLAGKQVSSQETLRSMMTKEAVLQLVSSYLAVTPGAAVKVGDSWKRDEQIPLGPLGSFTMNRTLKYAGPVQLNGANVDRIVIDGSMTYAPPAGNDPKAPFRITRGTMDAKQMKGEVLFDSQAGRMVSLVLEYETVGDFVLEASGQTVEMKIAGSEKNTVEVFDQLPSP